MTMTSLIEKNAEFGQNLRITLADFIVKCFGKTDCIAI